MIGEELELDQECVMGMDRRLRPGSKPLRNQCRGTDVQPQVYKSKKTFKERRKWVSEGETGPKTNHNHPFPLSQLKTPFRLVLVLIYKREQRGRLMLWTEHSEHIGKTNHITVSPPSTNAKELQGWSQNQRLWHFMHK